MQLFVLGMHRSGTSALTGLLVKAGAYAGPEEALLPAREANLKGYWERRDVVDLNEAILAFAGSDWRHIAGFDSTKLESSGFAPFKNQAEKIIAKLRPHRPWIIKDPRLCLTFPLWRELLGPSDSPVCILMYRRPVEVAFSLRKRDGLELAVGAALWEKYNREALRASVGLPRLLVAYHDLIERPVETARKMFDDLKRMGACDLRRLSESELREQIDPALQREQGNSETERENLGSGQLALLESLTDGSALQREAGELSPEALRALKEFEEADAHRDHWRPLRLKLRAMQELLKAGAIEAAKTQFAQAWKSGWKEPRLWRLKATIVRRGFADGHAKRALRQTMKNLNRLRAQADRG